MLDRPVVELTPDGLEIWEGEYAFVIGVVYDVTRDGAGLIASTPNGELTLIPVSETEFRIVDARSPYTDPLVRFRNDDGDRSLGVEIAGSYFTATRVPPEVTDPERLEAWVGSYRSDELGATAMIALDGRQLTYQIGFNDPQAATVRGDRTLSVRGMQAEGEQGADGRVDVFVVNAGRVQGIRFERSADLR